MSDIVIVVTNSVLLSITNQFSNSSIVMSSGARLQILLLLSNPSEAGASPFVLENPSFS
jgi:hypothetical protein